MKLAEHMKVVPVLAYGDLNAGVTLDTDSIDMKNFHHATFIIQIHALGVADAALTVHSGATNGAITSALNFRYAFGGAAQGVALCDVLAAALEVATLDLTNATYDNFMLVVEVDASKMDMANGENWLTMRFTDPGGATGNVTVLAVLKPRYTSDRSLTALA